MTIHTELLVTIPEELCDRMQEKIASTTLSQDDYLADLIQRDLAENPLPSACPLPMSWTDQIEYFHSDGGVYSEV